MARRLVPGGIVLRMYDVGVVERKLRRLERFAVAGETARAGGALLAGDVGDATAAALDQVVRRQPADRLVVRADVRGREFGKAAVDHDVRNVASFHSLEDLRRGGRL